jgi:hypothetical protein
MKTQTQPRGKAVLSALLLATTCAGAQLVVTVSRPELTGQKAIVRLGFKNEFDQGIQSARAAIFLLDEKGKLVAQGTQWVIGGEKGRPDLAPAGTNNFHFVLTSSKPFSTTNLTAKVTFNRVVLEGGRLADVTHDVVMKK